MRCLLDDEVNTDLASRQYLLEILEEVYTFQLDVVASSTVTYSGFHSINTFEKKVALKEGLSEALCRKS